MPEDDEDTWREEPPVVRIAHALLNTAIRAGAGGLRLTPGPGGVRVECLRGGAWADLPVGPDVALPPLPGGQGEDLTRRFQVMAEVNPWSSRGPQEGRFRVGCAVDEGRVRWVRVHAAFPAGPGGTATVLTFEDEPG